MGPLHQLDPYKVLEITTLGKAEDNKAKQLLEQVAKQMQPLLRRHQLRVPLLSEFFPRNPNLLGLNIGGGGGGTREIRIRLRRHGREREFFAFEHVLGTMLHEITHNHHGPHDAAFYKLLDQYTEECEELMAKGIAGSGQGFDAPAAGKAGGRLVGRGLGPHQCRELALKAAQERLKKQALMPAGPRKLGGDLSLRLTCDPRQAAAIAAERRAHDNLWCPAEHIQEEAAAGHSVDSAILQVLGNAGAALTGPGGLGQQNQTSSSRAALAAGSSHQRQQQQQQGQHRQQQQGQQRQQQEQQQPQQNAASIPPLAPASGAAGSLRGVQQGYREAQGPQQQRTGPGGAAVQPTWARASAGPAAAPVLGQARVTAEPGGLREAATPDIIDLTDEGNGLGGDAPAGHAGPAAAAAAGRAVPPIKRRKSGGGLSGAASQQWERSAGWACMRCTLLNRGLALQCDGCGQVRPAGFTG